MHFADYIDASFKPVLSLPQGGTLDGAWEECSDQGQLTCLLSVVCCAGVFPPSAREREGVPTDLLLPVCTAGEAQAAGLDAEAPGDAFALPCIATFNSTSHLKHLFRRQQWQHFPHPWQAGISMKKHIEKHILHEFK